MGYERTPRGTNQHGDFDGRRDPADYGRDDGYSSARDDRAAGQFGDDGGRGGYDGQRDIYDRGGRGAQRGDGRPVEYHGSYASDGRRFEDVGRFRHADDDSQRGRQGYRQGGHQPRGQQQQGGDHGRQPQGYDYDERGFLARAGDEVRSWFGDDEAERRREADSCFDDRGYGRGGRTERDDDYHSWRTTQIASLDRDYDEYRRENQSKFHHEFSSWRTTRQGQRDLLSSVQEHMDVVGSDGAHVGTVDKVRGDRILLTKTDVDAGGRHHSIPSSWITTVDTKVTLSKSADDAKAAWKDEERNQAMFGYGDNGAGRERDDAPVTQGRTLNTSFSGTY